MCLCTDSHDEVTLMLPPCGRIQKKKKIHLHYALFVFICFLGQLASPPVFFNNSSLYSWYVTACRDISCLNSITGTVSTDDCSTSLFSNASFFLGQTRRNSPSSGSREKPEPRTEPVHLQRPRKTDGVLRHVPGVLRNRNTRHKVAASHAIAAGHPGSHAH